MHEVELTERTRKHITETIVSDILQTRVAYSDVAEMVHDEFPGIQISDTDMVDIHTSVSEELVFAYDLWVNEE